MKAARFHGQRDIRIDDVPVPELRPGAVAIDVAWCGICGTDLHEFLEGPIFISSPGHEHPLSGEAYPVIMGHEYSGTITALGEGVTDLEVGQNVIVEPYFVCNECDQCKAGLYHLCDKMGFIGLAGGSGGLAEKAVVDRRWVHPVGDIPLDEAALIEPLSVGHHAVMLADPKPGQVALVGGAGPIGLLTAAVLKAFDVTVIMSEVSGARKTKALESGVADFIVDPTEQDVAEFVRSKTNGKGADLAFECSSVNAVLDAIIDSVKARATVVIVSIWSQRATFDIQRMVLKEIKMVGSIAYANDHAKTIELVKAGKVDLKPFITGKIGLDGLITEGFDTLIHRNETAVKILVSPNL